MSRFNVRKVAVLGAGVMGAQIAAHLVNVKVPVILFDLAAKPKDATCKDCTDERKDKPVVGMTIIRNMKASPADKMVFEGGDILDPNNGKVYSAKLKLVDDGRKLDVRGYIGMPMLGRTQTWQRVE